MTESGEEWELSKENIRPIQQGRKQHVLKVALAHHPDDVIAQQRQLFENELRTYSGNDPLAIWCKYIKWVEQNFPKGGREGHIKKLMGSCLSILKDDKRYFNDERFIDIMLNYANLSGKPLEIYNYMYATDIGCKSAKFFINWSWELEQLGNLKKADEVLAEGMKRRADPFEKIQSYRADFEIRLINKIKKDSEKNNFETESNRSAFTVLKPQKKKLAPVLRTGTAVTENKPPLIVGRQQPQPKSNASSGRVPFKIYDAENINPSFPVQSQPVVHSGFNLDFKENEQKPIKWNKYKIKTHCLKTPSEANPDFQFHCDENDQQLQTPKSVPKTSNILSVHRRTPSPPMALFEPPDPFKRPMYPKNKVYGGAVEYSLEEIRAAEWREKKKKEEQEKLLIEQQRKIEEQAKNEQQLKREIEVLAKKLQLLENKIVTPTALNKLSSTLNNDTVNLESQIDSNGFNGPLNKLSVMQTHNDKVSTQLTHSKENPETIFKKNLQNCSYNSTESFSKKRADSTSFCTADKMIQDLYNRTLNHIEDESKNLDSKVNDLACGISKEENGNLQFSFYHDPTVNIPNSNEIMPSREFSNENFLHSLNTTKHIDATQAVRKTSDNLSLMFHHDTTGENAEPNQMMPAREFVSENPFSSVNSSKLPFTVYHDHSKSSSSSNQMSQKQAISKESFNELPFTFFHDSPKSIETTSNKEVSSEKQLDLPCEEFPEEDIENIPPNGYIQSTTKRELAGILEPSKNIPFIPLEQQEQEDESDMEDDYIYQNDRQSTDDTLIPPSNTEQFSTAMFLASTPYVPKTSKCSKESSPSSHLIPSSEKALQNMCPPSEILSLSKQNVSNENAKSKIEIRSNKELVLNNDRKSICSSRLPNILSVIMETSAENYSKSSSSASSSASLTKSNHLEQYSSQHFSLHKNFSKLEACEPEIEQSKVSEMSNHHSNINIPNSSILMHNANKKETFKMELYQVDFDPFDASMIQKLLKSIDINNYRNVYHVTKPIRIVKCGENICIGNSTYMIESLIAEGAYAKVYKADKSFLACSDNLNAVVALKVCKKGNEWELYVCCEIHKRLSELKFIPDIKYSIMNVAAAIRYSDGIVLVNEYSSSGTLLDVVNFYKKQNSAIPEIIIMYFTLEILHIVSQLHKCNIIHGDIKPDNFLMTNDFFDFQNFEKMTRTTCLRLIDFGRSIDLNLYEKGICFTHVFNSKDLRCNEMKDKKPWVFQLDWYGVLSCIYTMLFSEYMVVSKKDGVWMIEKKFRRYWCTSLWEPLFNKLLNIPECYEEPDISPFVNLIESKLQENASNILNILTRFFCTYSQKI